MQKCSPERILSIIRCPLQWEIAASQIRIFIESHVWPANVEVEAIVRQGQSRRIGGTLHNETDHWVFCHKAGMQAVVHEVQATCLVSSQIRPNARSNAWHASIGSHICGAAASMAAHIGPSHRLVPDAEDIFVGMLLILRIN